MLGSRDSISSLNASCLSESSREAEGWDRRGGFTQGTWGTSSIRQRPGSLWYRATIAGAQMIWQHATDLVQKVLEAGRLLLKPLAYQALACELDTVSSRG